MVCQIEVELEGHHYPILIGEGLLKAPDVFRSFIAGTEVLIVTNATLAGLYLNRCQSVLAEYRVHTVVLPDGESYKNLETLTQIFDALMEQKFSRQVTLVALGGGVIGDMTGFAAACYQRGVHFIQVPTTLLAQVDASVGGKTGVNHRLGKNMIGAFYQPQAVLIDIDTLHTLPARAFSAGLAEVIKYGLIADADFFAWLEQNVEGILAKDPAVLSQMIARCCAIKAEVVKQDERETTGLRAILNLGHTFGHAIEAVMGYGEVLHGEAVAIGMVLALKFSENRSWKKDFPSPFVGEGGAQHRMRGNDDLHPSPSQSKLCSTSPTRGEVKGLSSTLNLTVAWLKRVGLPTELPTQNVDALINAMQHDKKKVSSQLRLVLLERLGAATLAPVNITEIRAFLQREVAHASQ